ncbi:Tim17/Tim22/Tim23/Pmp24 family-domain-containing protein [Lipomyces japonicus]|uniref:Tim17/Tim22/Tim23/Pmp24 family-domain-containing protein n=1 Tax=Lipomyces japonicus TaxID=56871 RepID=UPI0034CD782E
MVWPFNNKQSESATAPDSSSLSPSSTSTTFSAITSPPSSSSSSSSQQQQQTSSSQSQAELPSFLSDGSNLNIGQLHPLAGLGKDLEFLDLEDEALNDLPGSRGFLPSRGFSDDICYGTGTLYMSGLAFGGVYGFAEGLRSTTADAPAKLRLNAVLNAITRRGPYLGNTAGVLAVSYNIFNWSFGAYRGNHDEYNSIAAGTITGVLFRATKGIKQMAISGVIVGSLTGTWSFITRRSI